MTYSDVLKELKYQFEQYLIPKGFKCQAKLQGFEFKKSNHFQYLNIGFGVANYINEFNTGCYVLIGIKPIQNIQYKILNEFYDNTLGTNIGQYLNELNFIYKIKSISDIQEWMKIVKRYYEFFIINFFEQFSTIESIDELFNSETSKKVQYMDNLSARVMIGLIAAKLNNNPDYSVLRDYYFNEVETKFKGYFMYEKCMKVIEFLDQHTSESLNKLADDLEASLLKKGGPKKNKNH